MWYHIDIWVETSQLSPNASLLSTITLALSLTPICFEGKMHHIWGLTFVDENIDCPPIRWLRWRRRRYDHNIWSGVVLPVRGIEEIRVILSSASNGNNLANPFFPPNIPQFSHQTHFFNFQKHNQYAKPLAKPFDSSQTLVLIASRGKKHAFKKCHETNSEVVFPQSWPTTQKIFKPARLHVAQKWLFTFSHSGKKWTLLFLSFSRFLHYMTSGYAFLRMWSWNHAYGVFHVPATQLYALYAASDHFSVNFRYVRISHLSASFQGVMFKKQIC